MKRSKHLSSYQALPYLILSEHFSFKYKKQLLFNEVIQDTEIICLIVKFLDLRDIHAMYAVNRSLNKVLHNHPTIELRVLKAKVSSYQMHRINKKKPNDLPKYKYQPSKIMFDYSMMRKKKVVKKNQSGSSQISNKSSPELISNKSSPEFRSYNHKENQKEVDIQRAKILIQQIQNLPGLEEIRESQTKINKLIDNLIFFWK